MSRSYSSLPATSRRPAGVRENHQSYTCVSTLLTKVIPWGSADCSKRGRYGRNLLILSRIYVFPLSCIFRYGCCGTPIENKKTEGGDARRSIRKHDVETVINNNGNPSDLSCPYLKTPFPECFCTKLDSINAEAAVRYCGDRYKECEIYKKKAALRG